MLLKRFVPNEVVQDIYEIKPDTLEERGIKGIITDLDNTLVPWNVSDATEEVKEWLKDMEDHDIKVAIVSNNSEERVRIFSEPLNRPFAYSAKKPLTRAFKQVQKDMGLNKEEVVVVGDQLLTDIFGGNRAGLKTILVAPIVETDAPITRFNRKIERFIMRRLERKQLIKWEE